MSSGKVYNLLVRKLSFDRPPRRAAPSPPKPSEGPDPLLLSQQPLLAQRIDFGDGSFESARLRATRRDGDDDPALNPDLRPRRTNSWRRRVQRKASWERKARRDGATASDAPTPTGATGGGAEAARLALPLVWRWVREQREGRAAAAAREGEGGGGGAVSVEGGDDLAGTDAEGEGHHSLEERRSSESEFSLGGHPFTERSPCLERHAGLQAVPSLQPNPSVDGDPPLDRHDASEGNQPVDGGYFEGNPSVGRKHSSDEILSLQETRSLQRNQERDRFLERNRPLDENLSLDGSHPLKEKATFQGQHSREGTLQGQHSPEGTLQGQHSREGIHAIEESHAEEGEHPLLETAHASDGSHTVAVVTSETLAAVSAAEAAMEELCAAAAAMNGVPATPRRSASATPSCASSGVVSACGPRLVQQEVLHVHARLAPAESPPLPPPPAPSTSAPPSSSPALQPSSSALPLAPSSAPPALHPYVVSAWPVSTPPASFTEASGPSPVAARQPPQGRRIVRPLASPEEETPLRKFGEMLRKVQLTFTPPSGPRCEVEASQLRSAAAADPERRSPHDGLPGGGGGVGVHAARGAEIRHSPLGS